MVILLESSSGQTFRPDSELRRRNRGQMTLMELLGMERLQLQTSSELETLRLETRAAQVRKHRPTAG